MLVTCTLAISFAVELKAGYTSPKLRGYTLSAALDKCTTELQCAGITYVSISDVQYDLYAHSYVPEIDVDGLPDKVTFFDSTEFTFHSGRVFGSDVLLTGNYFNFTTAREYCRIHPECVAYSSTFFPGALYIFYRSVQSVVNDPIYGTMVSNDLKFSSKINSSSLNWRTDHHFLETTAPCCTQVTLPSIAEIEAKDSIERISCDISKEDFMERYEGARKPVMLVGCDKDWPAKDLWTMDNFKERFHNDSIWRAHLTHGDYLNDSATWKDVVTADDSQSGYYVFDQLTTDTGKEIEKEYTTPGPFQGSDMYGGIGEFPPGYKPRRWFCIGQASTGTLPHIDPIATDAWNSVLAGRKWWILYDENVSSEEDVECDPNCSDVENSNAAEWFASVGTRDDLFIEGNLVKTVHAVQYPGETIYVPYGMVHAVLNIEDSIAVTANFGSAANLDAVWEAINEEAFDYQWKSLYYTRLNSEQRARVRASSSWPPQNDSMRHFVYL